MVRLLWLIPALLLLPFVEGIATWCRGDGVMMGVGLFRFDKASIDPFTRLPQSSSGCLVNGYEWLYQEPHNAAIRAMTSLFGPAPGTYDGPIPSLDESRVALRQAMVIIPEDLANDVVRAGGRKTFLAPGLGRALLRACYPSRDDSWPPPGAIRATLWKERVLLIEMIGVQIDDDDFGQIVAIDAQRGLSFRNFPGTRTLCYGMPFPWRSIH
jgi:hypothetical protein